MLIDAIEVHHVRMPLLSPWRTASGDEDAIESVLVGLRSGDEVQWGESSPWGRPLFSSEWSAAAFELVAGQFAPLLVGRDLSDADMLVELLRPFKGNYFAKAAVDNAWWALHSALTDLPLARLLGGERSQIRLGADFEVMASFDQLIQRIGEAVDSGAPRVKLKFRPGWDVPMLEAVRGVFPDITMHIDCNSFYSLDDLRMFQQIDRFHLAMIEQPLHHDDLVDHAVLQAAIETPVCLDESIVSERHAKAAASLGSCRVINVKPGRVGGLTHARRIHDVAQTAGIACWVGGMLESGIGAYSCIALAALPNFTYPADIFPFDRFYQRDLGDPVLPVGTGPDPWLLPTPQAPGCPVAPNPDLLSQWAVRSATIAAEDAVS